MHGKMRFGVLVDVKKAEVHAGDIPEIEPDEVLMENRVCNICTTDYQHWLGLRPNLNYPMISGHENSGVVIEVGSNVNGIAVGDHVGEGIIGCGECANCKKNKNTFLCTNRVSPSRIKDKHGYYGYRGAAQFKAIKSRNIFKFNKNIAFTEMAFLEPLATVLQGIEKLQLQTGEIVLVIGAGTMGLLNAQAARLKGARVIVSDLKDKKVETAKVLGFANALNALDPDYLEEIAKITGGNGPDKIIFAVSSTKAYEQVFEIAPKGCVFLIFSSGYPGPEWKIDPNSVHYKLWQFIGTFGARVQDFQLSSELISNRSIDLTPLLEEQFNLDNIQAAFEKASTSGSYRVCLNIS